MPRQVFTAGEILTAANMNDLSDQTVMVFDDSAARGSAIPTPSEGMVTYLKDTNQVQAFDGSAFAPLGTILQVVSTTKTDTFSSTSGTFTAITGLTATITPSSTASKVLVTATLSIGHSTTFVFPVFILKRGGTQIGIGDVVDSRIGITTGGVGIPDNGNNATTGNVSINFLDSPNSTSALTYGIDVARNTGTFFVNRSGAYTNASDPVFGTSSSTITVMEVAG